MGNHWVLGPDAGWQWPSPWTSDAPVTAANALSNGSIFASADAVEGGSVHNWAGVAVAWDIPADAATITAAVDLTVTFNISAGAFLGYASAEALVSLWIWGSDDGMPAPASRSLARVITPFLWANGASGTPTVHLSAVVNRRRDASNRFIAARYGIGALVEAWAGVGAILGFAHSEVSTTVDAITLDTSP